MKTDVFTGLFKHCLSGRECGRTDGQTDGCLSAGGADVMK